MDSITKHMLDYGALSYDLKVNTKTGLISMQAGRAFHWNVELVDTGMNTQTGGPIKRLRRIIGNETFAIYRSEIQRELDRMEVETTLLAV
jgi:glucose-1-phosphate cytidylyltransferase